MALKDTWVDKVNGEDIVDANDINSIAEAVIELEENPASGGPDLSDSLPLMDGEAAAGESEEVSRADHVHPTDTTRMPVADLMASETNPSNTDTVIIHSRTENAMKKILWGRIITLIREAITSVATADTANSVTDTVNGYKAILPELTADAVIAIASDITDALANYYTRSETYSREEIDSRISAIPKFAIAVVSELPTADISETTVYLVATEGDTENLYTEYIYVNGAWEKLGEQKVDLTGYVTEAYLIGYAQPKGDYAYKNDIPTVPVQSVNGKTGAVELTAADVGAAPSSDTITITGVDEDGVTHTWTVYGVVSE